MTTIRNIKCLSVIQPWAELLVLGAKKIETRPMRTNYRGELFIHSSRKLFRGDLELCHQYKEFAAFIPDPSLLVKGHIIGKVEIVDCLPVEQVIGTISKEEYLFGDYTGGRFAWKVKNAVKFKTPIEAWGQLGIWNFELEEEEVCHV